MIKTILIVAACAVAALGCFLVAVIAMGWTHRRRRRNR